MICRIKEVFQIVFCLIMISNSTALFLNTSEAYSENKDFLAPVT